jgi:effector-binding domain-containing protein
VTDSFDALESRAAKHNARAAAPPFCEIECDDTWTVCVPISDLAADSVDAVVIGRPGIACSLTYVGNYSRTVPALNEMRGWIAGAGLLCCGPAREVYHRFGADQQDYRLPAHVIAARADHYVTELQIPVMLPREEQP